MRLSGAVLALGLTLAVQYGLAFNFSDSPTQAAIEPGASALLGGGLLFTAMKLRPRNR